VADSDELRSARRRQFGQTLKDIRAGSGKTQEVVALTAGLDRSFYVEVESGKHSPALDRVFDIADALGVPVGDLFSDPVFKP
jgi:transcriptional regulator with XRE-family HTH domain